MALSAVHGASRYLGDNYTRYLVKIADATTPASLLAASSAGKKRKIVSGVLYVAGACGLEIRNASGVVLLYAVLAGAAALALQSFDELTSGEDEALTIYTTAAVAIDGHVDVSEEVEPSYG